MRIVDCDYFVVGSGMSGLMTALHLAPAGKTVLVTKGRLEGCNSNFAQGGICCVADPADSFEAHVADTMIAGAGLCTEDVVRRIVTPAIELSSTDVRAAVAEGFPIEGAVPPAVAAYIRDRGLYRNA